MAATRALIFYFTIFTSLTWIVAAQSPTIISVTATAAINTPQETVLPTCARACVSTARNTMSCAPGDEPCLCKFSTQIQESIYKCLATTGCNEIEKKVAYEYYPQFCKGLGYATETKIPSTRAYTALATSTPGAAKSSITADAQSAPTDTANTTPGKTIHAGLQLPAILGIVLAVVVMIVGVAALLAWSTVRRRRMARRPRMDLGGELFDPLPRPPRSKSIKSDFLTEPSSTEKEAFGTALSRSSTLVPPPPVAKDDKRTSAEKRESARSKALKRLLGGDGLRTSLLSTHSNSKQPSLAVPPLDIQKSREEHMGLYKL